MSLRAGLLFLSVCMAAASLAVADTPPPAAPNLTVKVSGPVTVQTPDPGITPAPCSSPGPTLCFGVSPPGAALPPPVLVIVLAQDPTTQARISFEATRQLQTLLQLQAPLVTTASAPAPPVRLLGAPGWALVDYLNACLNSPYDATLNPSGIYGAVLVFNGSTAAATRNYVAIARGELFVTADAMLIRCYAQIPRVYPDPTNPKAKPLTQSDILGQGYSAPIYQYADLNGYSSSNSLSFGPITAVAGAIQAFNTATQHQIATQVNYASPAPAGVVTTRPYVAQVTDTTTKGYLNGLQLAEAGAIASYGSGAPLNFPGNNTDVQTRDAIGRLAHDLVQKVCPDWSRFMAAFTVYQSTPSPMVALAKRCKIDEVNPL